MKKTGARNVGLFIACAIIGLLGLMVFVRLAPTDPDRWHLEHAGADWAIVPWDTVSPETGGARLRVSMAAGDPTDTLARLDSLAMATARTRRIAGSVNEGRITWETRSLIWGFPDYTTAEARPDGVYVHARLRFGREDMGVNATRLKNWQAGL